MGALLALGSAGVYGVVDFAGGILSRRVHYARVAWLGQVGGLAFALVAALLATADRVTAVDLGWGALAGVGSAVTMLFLNRALARGSMSTVLPISAVTGVALSVLCGVWFLSEEPGLTAWWGILLMLPALWLVSRGRDATPAQAGAVRGGLIASLGVALLYIGLGLAGPESGLWAVVAGRCAAVLVLVPALLLAGRRPEHLPWRDSAKALLIGAGAALGLALYLLATREQLMAIAVALASLYPVVPVLLGVFVLREQVSRGQLVGLVASAVAVVLLSPA